MHIFCKLFVLCILIELITAGVKIEISRVKDPPKLVSIIPVVETDKSDTGETETTEATTIPTTTMPTTTELTTESVQKLNNSNLNTLNTTNEITTVAPFNAPGIIKPSQAINNNTNPLFNTTYASANQLNPYLTEFTRRQMRRRLIPTDYYCPCDLKV